MDVAASLTALITIAVQVGKLLSTYIREVRDAPEVLNNLLSEISSLTSVCKNLNGTMESYLVRRRFDESTACQGEHWSFIKWATNDCLKTLRSLETEWEPLSESRRKRPRLINMAVTQFKFHTETSKIDSYRLKILTAKEAINISLLALSVTSQFQAQDMIMGDLVPRLNETSSKITEVIEILNTKFQDIQLDDDHNLRESLGVAYRVAKTASDLQSTTASSAASFSEYTETQSVNFIDPTTKSIVETWVGSVDKDASSDAIMSVDLSVLGCERLLERGRAALAQKNYGEAESLFEQYLAVVQSEGLQIHGGGDVFAVHIELSRVYMEQTKMLKTRRILDEATVIASSLQEKAQVSMAYATYHVHPPNHDTVAAKSEWIKAANHLVSAFGSLSNTPIEDFEVLQRNKFHILSREQDSLEFDFWSNAVARSASSRSKKGATQNPRPRRPRKPTTSENREIEYAIENGDLEAIQKLKADGINTLAFECRASYSKKLKRRLSGFKCLHMSIIQEHPHLVEFFVQTGADPNQPAGIDMEPPLTLAADIPDVELALRLFRYLLQSGASIQKQAGEALRRAITHGNFELVRTMLSHAGISARELVNKVWPESGIRWKISFLQTASRIKDKSTQFKIVKAIIEAGMQIDHISCNDSYPVLWDFDPSWPSFRYLIEKGANVKPLPQNGTSILHQQYNYNRFSLPVDMIQLVVEKGKGADLNQINSDGETPLISALKHGARNTAMKYIELGCDVNLRGQEAAADAITYALNDVYAEEHKLSGVACALLDKGAIIKSPDETLHGAIKYGDEGLVEKLILAGVDVNRRCSFELSPLAYARDLRPGNGGIVTMLERNGANLHP